MGNILDYLGNMNGRKNSSRVHRSLRQKYYRWKLANSLKESIRKGGQPGNVDALQTLEKEKTTDKYILAKYGTDKKGALAIINFAWNGLEIFLRNIDEFTGLDEEVAIEICKRSIYLNENFISFGGEFWVNLYEFWENLDEFSVGNKFVNYFIENYNYVGSFENLFYAIKLSLDKKDIFDENDANHINALVNRYYKLKCPYHPFNRLIFERTYKFIVKNIMKFPDKSLDYSVFQIGGTLVNENFFLKFKTYEEHVVSGGKKSHTPGDEYDSEFERLYYNVYEKPGIRENNLQSMEKMGFGELISLFVSKDKSRREGVDDGEIIKMLSFKKVKPGEKIKQADIGEFLKRIDKKKKKELWPKLRLLALYK